MIAIGQNDEVAVLDPAASLHFVDRESIYLITGMSGVIKWDGLDTSVQGDPACSAVVSGQGINRQAGADSRHPQGCGGDPHLACVFTVLSRGSQTVAIRVLGLTQFCVMFKV